MAVMPCAECASIFEPRNAKQKYCSDKCRYAAKDRLRAVPCAACGEPMLRQSKIIAGVSKHQSCRHSYGSGCRCADCRANQAARMRAYADAVREEHGVGPSALSRRAFRDANGYWPHRRGSDWIGPKLRLQIYERDGWACHICSGPVARDAHWNDNFAPSLDHLVPRSIGGSHDSENLKTAHRVCNSKKGASLELA